MSCIIPNSYSTIGYNHQLTGSVSIVGDMTITGDGFPSLLAGSTSTVVGSTPRLNAARSICIMGRGHSSIVGGDTIINGIRFFPVGSEIHTSRARSRDETMAAHDGTADLLAADPDTYYGRIPGDIRGIVRSMLGSPDGLFEITLLSGLRRGNIAEVVGSFWSKECWDRIPAIRAEIMEAVANLPAMHRPEYLTLLRL